MLVGHSYGGDRHLEAYGADARARSDASSTGTRSCSLDGEPVYDVSPPHYNALMDALAAESGDGTVVLPYPVWREGFMNDADDALARKVYDECLSPHPVRVLPGQARAEGLPVRSRSRVRYLNCTEDIAMPPARWAGTPRFSSRLGLYRLVQMPGGHEAMYTNPTLLAQKLQEAGVTKGSRC